MQVRGDPTRMRCALNESLASASPSGGASTRPGPPASSPARRRITVRAICAAFQRPYRGHSLRMVSRMDMLARDLTMFGEVDPVRRRKLRHKKEESRFPRTGKRLQRRRAAFSSIVTLTSPWEKAHAHGNPHLREWTVCTWSAMYFDERADARRPGVLVFPEAFGLGDHAKSRAERLAGIGYVALACDLHGDGRLLHNLDEALALVEAAPGRSVAGSHARTASTHSGPARVRP